MRQNQQQHPLPLLKKLSIGLILSIIFIAWNSNVDAQVAGTDLCACSPRVYELTFDFALECDPINVDVAGDGILDATCLVTGATSPNITDFVPVAVSSVQIIEIGQDGLPAAFAQETGDFRDGATITYTSISFEGEAAPRAFQVRALGRNADGDPLVLQWAVTYSNNCGVFPVLELFDSVGWTVFVSYNIIKFYVVGMLLKTPNTNNYDPILCISFLNRLDWQHHFNWFVLQLLLLLLIHLLAKLLQQNQQCRQLQNQQQYQ